MASFIIRTRLSTPMSIKSLDVDFSLSPIDLFLLFVASVQRFLWLLHGVFFHRPQHVNAPPPTPILRKLHVLPLPLPLLLLLTARELVLTWSPALFRVLTVLPPVTIPWIEPKSQNIATSCVLH